MAKLGILSPVDQSVIVTYAQAVDTYERLKHELDSVGLLQSDRLGRMAVTPAVKQMMGFAEILTRMATQLGLTPVGRKRLGIKSGSVDPDNGMNRFL